MSLRKNARYFIYLGLTFALGMMITIIVFRVALNKEKEEFRTQFISKADSIGFSLDLMIAHNTIRLQNFEENLGLDLKNRNQNFILATLNSSVFSTFAYYKTSGVDSNNLPIFERLTLIDAKKEGNLTSAESKSKFMSSVKLRSAINNMNQYKDKYISLFVENEGRIYFVLVMRSTTEAGRYYVFSGNVTDLLASYVQISRESQVILHQIRDGSYWLISHVDPKKKLIQIKGVSKDEEEELIDSSEMRRDYIEKFVGDTFNITVFSDYATQPGYFWPFVVLGSGALITGLISLLLYSLITRNIDVENQVRVKTIDLEIQTEKALEASAAKTRFLANISHEIRTPLNIILGMTDLLQETSMTQQQVKFLNSLRTSSQHLIALIEDILDMARIDSNDVDFKETTVNLVELFEDVCRIVGPNVLRKRLKLYVDLDVDVPVAVLADPARLRQIFINLINNSVKFTETGFIAVSLKKMNQATSSTDHICVEICVQDTGIGIPLKNQEDVFKAFYQVNPAITRLKGGVGLGLSIVNAIVDRMNGAINLKSEVNLGTTFTVSLPLKVMSTTKWSEQNLDLEKISSMKFLVSTQDEFMQSQILKYLQKANSVGLSPVTGLSKELQKDVDFYILDRDLLDRQQYELLPEDMKRKVILIENDVFSQVQEGTFVSLVTPTQIYTAIGVLRGGERHLAQAASQKETLLSRPMKNLDLVIVDDDQSNRELIAAYLKGKSEWTARFAEDGQTALDLCIEQSPDILVADLQMPHMDGFTLSKKLKEYQQKNSQKSSKIVILTADALEETADQAKLYSVDLYLTKPIRKSKFIDAIQSLL